MGFRPFLYDSDKEIPYILVNAHELASVLQGLRTADIDFIASSPQQGTSKIQFPAVDRGKLMKVLTRISTDIP